MPHNKRRCRAAANETRVICQRCECQVRIEPTPLPQNVRMLRRSRTAHGYCVNCAVHDWLRNTYPCNLTLARSGPHALLYPSVQEQFIAIMRAQQAEAHPAEISWPTIVAQWDLPFPTRIRQSAANPMNEEDLAQAHHHNAFYGLRYETMRDRARHDGIIRTFAELNEIEPGLGDQLREAIRATVGKTGRPMLASPLQVSLPPQQLRLL